MRFLQTRGPFQQRLVYERLIAPLVPLAMRRDLKQPAWLHLDPAERFPRLRVEGSLGDGPGLFGPFRERRAAEKARDAVQRRFPLRPCDYRFEPAEELALGMACLYAQVRSCAAPCLRRVSEEQYRELATEVAGWLSDPARRTEAPAVVPAVVASAATARALVVDLRRERVGLYPVLGGRVLDEAAREVALDELPQALAALDWTPREGPSDWPWLLAWLRSPKARACYLPVVGEPRAIEESVRALVRTTPGGPGDNVGATRRTP